MKNYTKTNIGNEGRTELHEKLSLTDICFSQHDISSFILPISENISCLTLSISQLFNEVIKFAFSLFSLFIDF